MLCHLIERRCLGTTQCSAVLTIKSLPAFQLGAITVVYVNNAPALLLCRRTCTPDSDTACQSIKTLGEAGVSDSQFPNAT